MPRSEAATLPKLWLRPQHSKLLLAALLFAFTTFAAPPPLRVCSDPNNLPFSNSRGEGFENKLAQLVARELGTTVSYTWFAQRRGFVRNTLTAGKCDLIVGVPSSFELALTTRPYYRSSYVFVTRRDRKLAIESLDDPRLRKLRIGVQIIGDDYASSPPAHALANRGIVRNVAGYLVYGDHAQESPTRRIIDAVATGESAGGHRRFDDEARSADHAAARRRARSSLRPPESDHLAVPRGGGDERDVHRAAVHAVSLSDRHRHRGELRGRDLGTDAAMRALAGLLLIFSCSPNVEQDAHPRPPVEPAPSASLASQDRDFLERAAEGSNAEVAMGALVGGRASRGEVIAFGKLMVADHTAINQQLAAIAKAKRIALPTSLGEHQQNYDRIVDLRREEFDREFVRTMLSDHQEAVGLFRNEASGGVDPHLKAFAAATLPKIEEHLRHAEGLRR